MQPTPESVTTLFTAPRRAHQLLRCIETEDHEGADLEAMPQLDDWRLLGMVLIGLPLPLLAYKPDPLRTLAGAEADRLRERGRHLQALDTLRTRVPDCATHAIKWASEADPNQNSRLRWYERSALASYQASGDEGHPLRGMIGEPPARR